MNLFLLIFLLLGAVAGCSTPYDPPVIVHGASKFPGIVDFLNTPPAQPLNVVLVHGMCTHDERWAESAIENIVYAIDSNVRSEKSEKAFENVATGEIRTIRRTVNVGGGSVNFSAFVWSPLTAAFKSQLTYDNTGTPTDCLVESQCKPKRASLNGALKDNLLNDCLADALAYQGRSRDDMRLRMVEALSSVLETSAASAHAAGMAPNKLVIVTESLGSKLTFDALEEMILNPNASARAKTAGVDAVSRLSLIFMGANQLPILGLADQGIRPATAGGEAVLELPAVDSLHRILTAKTKQSLPSDAAREIPVLTLVAYTDPNDLLSYRLEPSRYHIPGVAIADVLVSNSPTYLGLIERPDHAHIGYRNNKSVAALIACGSHKHARCK